MPGGHLLPDHVRKPRHERGRDKINSQEWSYRLIVYELVHDAASRNTAVRS
jgi:hypothetical protein